jgi:hypothetical protein
MNELTLVQISEARFKELLRIEQRYYHVNRGLQTIFSSIASEGTDGSYEQVKSSWNRLDEKYRIMKLLFEK